MRYVFGVRLGMAHNAMYTTLSPGQPRIGVRGKAGVTGQLRRTPALDSAIKSRNDGKARQ
jgi:hypothetical protein